MATDTPTTRLRIASENLRLWVDGPREAHQEIRDHEGLLKESGIWREFQAALEDVNSRKPKRQNAAVDTRRAEAQIQQGG